MTNRAAMSQPICDDARGLCMPSENDDLAVAVDQAQKTAQIYDDRRRDADTNAGAVLTAAVTLATLTVTAHATLGSAARSWYAVAATSAAGVSALAAAWARVAAGLRLRVSAAPRASTRGGVIGRVRVELTHESLVFRTAAGELSAWPDSGSEGIAERALGFWRARESDSHRIAQAKERAVAVAGLALCASVCFVAALGVALVG
jgi:hypothetical protein